MKNSPARVILLLRAYLRLLTKQHGLRVVAIFFLSLILGLVNGIGILMLVPLLELVGVPGSGAGAQGYLAIALNAVGLVPSIEAVLVAFIIVVCSHALLLRWTNIVKSHFELSFAKSLQDRLFAAIAQAGWSFFVQRRSSDFTHALTSNLDRVATATFYLLRLLSSLLAAGIHVLIALSLSLPVTAICGATALVMGGILRRQNRVAAETGEQVTSLSEMFYGEISDHLGGMKEVKSLGAENRQVDRFVARTDQIANARLRFSRVRETTTCIYAIMSATLLASLLFVSVQYLEMQPAELIVLVLVFARLAPRLRDLHLSYQQILNAAPAFKSALEMQQQCDAAAEPVSETASSCWTVQQSIVLNNVSYQYGGDSRAWALRGANLTIPAQQTTVIVGASGAGKSTLAGLLLGLMTPSEGTILIDGQLLEQSRLRDWRQAIGYVPQSTFLLHDTIRANLLWARESASEEDLRSALQMAAADSFVDQLPAGLDTIVGDRGSRLSGGEAQRIALARALLRNPSTLILDEATNSLDTHNQQRIESAIQQLHGQMTVIIVAHRLNSIQDADQIVVLERGQIVEVGSFRDLAQQEGCFRAILNAENSSPAPQAVGNIVK